MLLFYPVSEVDVKPSKYYSCFSFICWLNSRRVQVTTYCHLYCVLSSWTCSIRFIWCRLSRQSILSRTLHITSRCRRGPSSSKSLIKVLTYVMCIFFCLLCDRLYSILSLVFLFVLSRHHIAVFYLSCYVMATYVAVYFRYAICSDLIIYCQCVIV